MLETTVLAAWLCVLAAGGAPIQLAEAAATPTAPAGEGELPGAAGTLHPSEDQLRVLDKPPPPKASADPGMPGSLPGGAGTLPGGAGGGLPSTGAPGRNVPDSGAGGAK